MDPFEVDPSGPAEGAAVHEGGVHRHLDTLVQDRSGVLTLGRAEAFTRRQRDTQEGVSCGGVPVRRVYADPVVPQPQLHATLILDLLLGLDHVVPGVVRPDTGQIVQNRVGRVGLELVKRPGRLPGHSDCGTHLGTADKAGEHALAEVVGHVGLRIHLEAVVLAESAVSVHAHGGGDEEVVEVEAILHEPPEVDILRELLSAEGQGRAAHGRHALAGEAPSSRHRTGLDVPVSLAAEGEVAGQSGRPARQGVIQVADVLGREAAGIAVSDVPLALSADVGVVAAEGEVPRLLVVHRIQTEGGAVAEVRKRVVVHRNRTRPPVRVRIGADGLRVGHVHVEAAAIGLFGCRVVGVGEQGVGVDPEPVVPGLERIDPVPDVPGGHADGEVLAGRPVQVEAEVRLLLVVGLERALLEGVATGDEVGDLFATAVDRHVVRVDEPVFDQALVGIQRNGAVRSSEVASERGREVLPVPVEPGVDREGEVGRAVAAATLGEDLDHSA